ncbi:MULTISPECIES: hypothetical protein [unclassified Yoonia]|uniref:hypothetical protein n=1 Tax=unclassified Yoonia TaxID=2629118 RepID=UPI002AFFAD16|nr:MULTISPECIES: hypothetical protein [unclassified Yoonia]
MSQEFKLAIAFVKKAELKWELAPDSFLTYPGRGTTIIKTQSNKGKRKMLSGYFFDPSDNKKVHVDMLIGSEVAELEIWLWKPEPSDDPICVPKSPEVMFDP